MEGNFKTFFGGNLEWHNDPQDKPEHGKHILVAYTYKKGCAYDVLIDKLFFGDSSYLRNTDSTMPVAWSYVDRAVPQSLLMKMIKDRDAYEAEHADEIKAKRIAELEAELADLKK